MLMLIITMQAYAETEATTDNTLSFCSQLQSTILRQHKLLHPLTAQLYVLIVCPTLQSMNIEVLHPFSSINRVYLDGYDPSAPTGPNAKHLSPKARAILEARQVLHALHIFSYNINCGCCRQSG